MNLTKGAIAIPEGKIRFGRIVYYNYFSKHGFIKGEDGFEYFFLLAWAVAVDWDNATPSLGSTTDKTLPRVGERVMFHAQPARSVNERLRATPWGHTPAQRVTARRLPVLPPEQLSPPREPRLIDTILLQKSSGDAAVLKGLLHVRTALSVAAVQLFCELTPPGRELLANVARAQGEQKDPGFGWVEYAQRVLRENALKIVGPRSCKLAPEIRLRTWVASFRDGMPDDATLLSIYLEDPMVLKQFLRACTGCKMRGCEHYRSGYRLKAPNSPRR